MTLIESAKKALEALDGVAQWVDRRPRTHPWDAWQRVEPAMVALRTAIAEAEKQEPVGVVAMDTSNTHVYYGTQYVGQKTDAKIVMLFKDLPLGTPVYTTPPAVQQEPVFHLRQYGDVTQEGIERLANATAPAAQRQPLNLEPLQEFWRNNPSLDWEELEAAVNAAYGMK